MIILTFICIFLILKEIYENIDIATKAFNNVYKRKNIEYYKIKLYFYIFTRNLFLVLAIILLFNYSLIYEIQRLNG